MVKILFKIVRYLGVAFESILINKMRSSLTMLGIIIGVAAVLSTIGVGRGASASITDQVSSQGTSLLTINPGSTSEGGVATGESAQTLTMGDAEALENSTYNPAISAVAPAYNNSAQLVYGSTNSNNQIVGTTASYASVHNSEIESGRFLSEEDVTTNEKVVVLGYNVATDLFESEDPLNKQVRIAGEPFTVIGVMAESGSQGFNSGDDQAYIPIGVAQSRLSSATRYRGDYVVSSIGVLAINEESVDAATQQIEQTLRLRHSLALNDDNDFEVSNNASLLETLSSVTSTLTLLLGGIGGISLLVGGIGIMNIMLVSVTERTKEIGLRKALGAHDSDILLQFLVEALVLTFIGGLIGILISYGVSVLVGILFAGVFSLIIGTDSILLALGVSVSCGLVFGLYPAMRATRLNPIEALRYE